MQQMAESKIQQQGYPQDPVNKRETVQGTELGIENDQTRLSHQPAQSNATAMPGQRGESANHGVHGLGTNKIVNDTPQTGNTSGMSGLKSKLQRKDSTSSSSSSSDEENEKPGLKEKLHVKKEQLKDKMGMQADPNVVGPTGHSATSGNATATENTKLKQH
eukprot:NODE_807_length_3783_cov_0.538002.p3 type:complete len:161 gc:universal NODE_807_length_3783_cov_0.538002:2798-3280(+)